MDQEKIDAWVRAVNKKALDLDEWARSMHPASWLETFQQENEDFRKLAQRGPISQQTQEVSTCSNQ